MPRHLFITLTIIAGLTACTANNNPLTPDTALQSYLNNGDRSFSWELKARLLSTDTINLDMLKLTSQQWRGIPWTHQLTVISPAEIISDGALLFITGGSNKNGEPNWKERDGTILRLAAIATTSKAVVAVLSQVPNQPLFDDLTEDALISFTLQNYKNDGDFTWPLLFPMTKSAVKAMDAVQQYSRKELKHKIKRFVVSGASKRGWTTWLAASQDQRIVAIAPMVIDVLNMPVNIPYQKEVWGDYSAQIEDYVKLGIAQDMGSSEGKDLVAMIDPYSYREKLGMPKMIIMGTNDEYWPVDAIKNYFNDIPGENYIHYEPNVGHGMGDGTGVLQTLSAFLHITLNGRQHPECDWQVSYDTIKTNLQVNAAEDLKNVTLWMCDSPDLDFRDNKFIDSGIAFTDPAGIKLEVAHPDSGFRAFYVDLTYPHPVAGNYSKSTRMFVAGKGKLFLN